ncbi:MAG: hypothetical protein H8E10_19215 [Desulfobacterales bacterium]|nr:hypothetical protein [Desulfobacterales bacterium]MBU0735456.1 hypothetical protein [Pseudomonadota bacterium]
MGDDELEGVEVITFQVSRIWNPKLAGISGDDRDLGVAVADLGRRGLLSVRGQ